MMIFSCNTKHTRSVVDVVGNFATVELDSVTLIS